MPLCKNHFVAFLRALLARGFVQIYRQPDVAYASMDMFGLGFVEPSTFAGSICARRVINNFNATTVAYRLTPDDVREWAAISGLFGPVQDKNGGYTDKVGMRLAGLKKAFFPHLAGHDKGEATESDRVDADEPEEAGKAAVKSADSARQQVQMDATMKRITDFERKVRARFSQRFGSVNKAFLFLDSDHDGYITIEDFMRVFGDISVSYEDMAKLIKERDSKHVGKLNYQDFSAWVGSSIHVSEGFFFRHDSHRNPQYEKKKLQLNERAKLLDSASKGQRQLNLKEKVVLKIRQQWGSILKAFKDIHKNPRTNGISEDELKFYLNHWGFCNLTE